MNVLVQCTAVVFVIGVCLTSGDASNEVINKNLTHQPPKQAHPTETLIRAVKLAGTRLSQEMKNIGDGGDDEKTHRVLSRLISDVLTGPSRRGLPDSAPLSTKSRTKRSPEQGLNAQSIDPDGVDLELGWGKCDIACGIGYQSRRGICFDQSDLVCKGGDGVEVRRCLGIDCENAEELESRLACGGASHLLIGIVVGIAVVLVTIGVAFGVKTYVIPWIIPRIGKAHKKLSSSSKPKRKGSKRPPAPPPRTQTKGKGGGTDDDHLYEEIDGIPSEKTKAGRNRYVTMTSKPKTEKKRLRGSKKKQKEREMVGSEEESDHGYVDPDELNQPGSEEVEIERLREPPPPPGTSDKKRSKTKPRKRPSSHNEYEIPKENDYLELDA